MPKGLYTDRAEHVLIRDYDDAPLGPKQLRVETELAAIKHGTELHVFSGKSPFQARRFDGRLRMFVPSEGGGGDGIVRRFLGNTAVGRVVEVGPEVTGHRVGDRVYGYGPIAQTVTFAEDRAHPLVDGLKAEDALCLDPALFALGGVQDARPVLGDNVIVFGLGAIGQLAVQMLRQAGALNLVAVDPIARRRELAERFGASDVLDPAACDVGLEVRRIAGVGADIALEASGNYRALAEALRCVRPCGRAVTIGYYQGVATPLELGAEWHHNRLELISSMPDWGNPSRDHPRWDRDRMQAVLPRLFREGRLVSEGLIDPVVDFADAAEAFMAIYRDPSRSVKLGVRF